MRGNTYRVTRIGAYVASAALVVSGTVLAAAPAGAANDSDPMDAASQWLNDQLTSGLMHNDQYDFDDYGLSVDTGLALLATGGHAGTVQLISGAIADHISSYIGNDAPEAYAGQAAKAAVFARAAGDDPTAYGGVDLINRIEQRVSATGVTKGRVQDKSNYGDNANTLGQSYAVNALTAAGSGKSADATSFLLKQQCSSGYFRLYFSSKTAANQTCMNGTSAPDPDATAVAVLQLSAVTGNTAVTSAVARAKAWLKTQQRCDGAFGGGPTTTASNSNTTGVVSWALGDTLSSRQAAVWLQLHQANTADNANGLSGDLGAIAYSYMALGNGRQNGITDSTADQWRRATTQGAPGLKWFSTEPTPAFTLTGPTGYLKARSHPVVKTTGAAPGTLLCLNGDSTAKRILTGSGASYFTVNLPGRTALAGYTARDPFGNSANMNIKVLGARKLPVGKSSYRVKRKHKVTATVYGLAPNEWSRIYYKGHQIASGPASSVGTFTATFKVGKAKGKRVIAGYGRFLDIRRGATTIKVVR